MGRSKVMDCPISFQLYYRILLILFFLFRQLALGSHVTFGTLAFFSYPFLLPYPLFYLIILYF